MDLDTMLECFIMLEAPKDEAADNTSEEGQPLLEFQLFPKLPKEIREKIWLYTLPRPRYVRVKARKAGSFSVFSMFGGPNTARILAPKPALLGVNMEARTVAKAYFKLSFNGWQSSKDRAIYFDWDNDFLYFKDNADIEAFYESPYASEQDHADFAHNLKNLLIWLPRIPLNSMVFKHLEIVAFPDMIHGNEREQRVVQRQWDYKWFRTYGFIKAPRLMYIDKEDILRQTKID